MAFCKNCGNQLDDNAVVCPQCGTNVAAAAPVEEKASFGWAVLGFFIPLVGLILYLVWRNEQPAKAKKAGIGALVGVIVNIILSIIGSIVGSALAAMFLKNTMYY